MDKRMRILHAAIKEFHDYEYQTVSTNRIVELADVSKGTLFNYFGSKEKLYQSCIEYAFDRSVKVYEDVEYPFEGYIERLTRLTQMKSRYQAKEPHVSRFLLKLYSKRELPDKMQAHLDSIISEFLDKMFDNIDLSLFKEDLDLDKVLDIIRWTIEGYSNQLTEMLENGQINFDELDKYYDQFEGYLEVMRKIYYKGDSIEHS